MDVTIYFENKLQTTIHHVDDITWSRQNVYINIEQTWNESNVPDEPFIFKREMISQILINNI